MSNFEVLGAVHGIAPRSDALLELGGRVERGRAAPEDYHALLVEEEHNWLAHCQEAGLTYYDSGKRRWQDHLRPFVYHTDGFAEGATDTYRQAGDDQWQLFTRPFTEFPAGFLGGIDEAPLNRWPNTNTFYRRPTITDELNLHAESFSLATGDFGPYLNYLAPYSFAECCDDISGIDKITNITRIYKQLLEWVYREGSTETVLFHEAYPTELFDGRATEAISDIARDFPQLDVGYISSAAVSALALDAPQNVGYGISPETLSNLQTAQRAPLPGPRPDLRGRTLWYQAVRGDTTSEDRPGLDRLPTGFVRSSGARRLILTNTVDLQLVPYKVAKHKVARLGELVDQTQQQFDKEGAL